MFLLCIVHSLFVWPQIHAVYAYLDCVISLQLMHLISSIKKLFQFQLDLVFLSLFEKFLAITLTYLSINLSLSICVMYVCMYYVFMYVCMYYVFMYVCMYVCMYVSVHVCLCVCMCVCMYVCM